MPLVPFSAVLLAGGRSTRMGRDKALLPLVDGRLLWQRQLAVLQELGPAELFFSGPAREGLGSEVIVLEDAAPGLGPLAGLVRALEAMKTPQLLTLAVDLPEMTHEFLARLLAQATGRQGIVPEVDGRAEPLAAVYPAEALPIARARLGSDDRSLQGFVRALAKVELVSLINTTQSEGALFTNWNRPTDYCWCGKAA